MVQTLGLETLSDEGKTNPMVDLLIAVINQFSQMERAFLIDRINSGLAKSKANGKVLGRRQDSTMEDSDLLKKYGGLVRDLRAKISVRKAALISWGFYRYCSKSKKGDGRICLIFRQWLGCQFEYYLQGSACILCVWICSNCGFQVFFSLVVQS